MPNSVSGNKRLYRGCDLLVQRRIQRSETLKAGKLYIDYDYTPVPPLKT